MAVESIKRSNFKSFFKVKTDNFTFDSMQHFKNNIGSLYKSLSISSSTNQLISTFCCRWRKKERYKCICAYLLSNYGLLNLFSQVFVYLFFFSLWHFIVTLINLPRADFLLMRVNMLLCRASPAPLTSQAAVLLLKQSRPFFTWLSAKSS